jgi:hypothetical protein
MKSLQTIGAIGAGTMGTGGARRGSASAAQCVSVPDTSPHQIPTKCRRFADDLPHFFDYAGTT